MTVLDKGPWHVNQWSPKTEGGRPRVVLQSDDFTHDAALEISGDFGDLETLLEDNTWTSAFGLWRPLIDVPWALVKHRHLLIPLLERLAD
jgi:hypothetical protein